MKFLALFLICLLKLSVSASQELVVNGDFEKYIKCPEDYGNIGDAVGWSQLFESSDYYNACITEADFLGIPNNFSGHQEARSGEGYAGLFLFMDEFEGKLKKEDLYVKKEAYYRREHIQTKLKEPLVKGKTYILLYPTKNKI